MANPIPWWVSGCLCKTQPSRTDVFGASQAATRDLSTADPRLSTVSPSMRNTTRLITRSQILCLWRCRQGVWQFSRANSSTRVTTTCQKSRDMPIRGIWWTAVLSGAPQIGCREPPSPNLSKNSEMIPYTSLKWMFAVKLLAFCRIGWYLARVMVVFLF